MGFSIDSDDVHLYRGCETDGGVGCRGHHAYPCGHYLCEQASVPSCEMTCCDIAFSESPSPHCLTASLPSSAKLLRLRAVRAMQDCARTTLVNTHLSGWALRVEAVGRGEERGVARSLTACVEVRQVKKLQKTPEAKTALTDLRLCQSFILRVKTLFDSRQDGSHSPPYYWKDCIWLTLSD